MKYTESYNRIKEDYKKELKEIFEQYIMFRAYYKSKIVNKTIYAPVKVTPKKTLLVKNGEKSCYEIDLKWNLKRIKELFYFFNDKRPEQILFILFLLFEKAKIEDVHQIKINNCYYFDMNKNKFFINKKFVRICNFLDKLNLPYDERKEIEKEYCIFENIEDREYLFLPSKNKFIALTKNHKFLDKLNNFVSYYNEKIYYTNSEEKINDCLYMQIGYSTYILLSPKHKNPIIIPYHYNFKFNNKLFYILSTSFSIDLETFKKESINVLSYHYYSFEIKKNKNIFCLHDEKVCFGSDLDVFCKKYEYKKLNDNCFLFILDNETIINNKSFKNIYALLFNKKLYILDKNLFNEIISNYTFKKMCRHILAHIQEIESKHKQFCLEINL